MRGNCNKGSMKRIAALLLTVTTPAWGQPVYQVPLTDQEIEAIIQMGSVCLKTMGYDCGVAFEIRAKLQSAKVPRPTTTPSATEPRK